ncbi:MAG: slipin family protein [Myxococcaceae bacterium]|jgi:regulator of protease activity HflC (stomatin/prohibitin superfamily)|nr:slipin family protein [Myxococcaceae bacterium]
MKIEILVHERAFVLVDGKPTRYLTPGVHRVVSLLKPVKVEKLNVSGLLAELDEQRLALVPAADLAVVTLAEHERALVRRRGKPVLWLGAGVHQVWTVDRLVDRKTLATKDLVTIETFDTSAVEAKVLSPDVAALAKGKDYVEVQAPAGSVAVRWVDGRLDEVLPAGRYAAWTTLRTVQFTVIELKERQLHVTGQEVMTKDRVTLRLNVSASFRVADPRRLAVVARSPDDVVYLAMQLSARDAITVKTLDELLQARDELAKEMTPAVKARAEAVGLELIELGVKDVVLPGDMKELLNKVIEAQKQAEANVILRREETNATRSLAQTAKLLADNPLLLKLKELEAYTELAGKVGQVHVVMGQGGLPTLQLTTGK